jgi:phosphatidylglycerophosphatase A
VLLWWLLAFRLPAQLQVPAVLLLAGVATVLGIPAATRVVRQTGLEDPGFVVIDEVAGQLIALTAAPLRWKSLLLGFILFRAFDILKPPPLRLLERLPEGTGIVVDDIGAGLYALAGMQLLLHYGFLR